MPRITTHERLPMYPDGTLVPPARWTDATRARWRAIAFRLRCAELELDVGHLRFARGLVQTGRLTEFPTEVR